MEERESGWDPRVKRYFKKIINSVVFGSLWILFAIMAGLYYELAFFDSKPVYQNIIFYVIVVGGLILLIRYLYKIWKAPAV